MDQIPKSGFYYPNRFALITLEALEEVMGKNGLNAILNMAHMPHLIDHYPPANLDRTRTHDLSCVGWFGCIDGYSETHSPGNGFSEPRDPG